MPFQSQAQSRFIHWKAGEGVPWAQKFVSDAQHGEGSVKALPKRSVLDRAKDHMRRRIG